MSSSEGSGRRGFVLKLVAATASVGVAGLTLDRFMGRSVAQASDLAIDGSNTGSGTTSLLSPGNPGLMATNTSNGAALQGTSTVGTGVYGTTTSGTGVGGVASDSSGMGVQGFASSGGTGVVGLSSSGVGVRGQAGGSTAIPFVAQAADGQTANLQEWQKNDGTALTVVDKDGQLGVGIAAPVRQVHIRGNTAVARLDRNVDSASFIFTRTAAGNFDTVWKSFTFGVKASGLDSGSFFIGDMHTNVSGSSDNRILIDTNDNVGIGTTTPSSKLHVAGRVKALGYDTGDITYANGMKTTEEGLGLAFLNDAGEKIAVLDREGNFHIKATSSKTFKVLSPALPVSLIDE